MSAAATPAPAAAPAAAPAPVNPSNGQPARAGSRANPQRLPPPGQAERQAKAAERAKRLDIRNAYKEVKESLRAKRDGTVTDQRHPGKPAAQTSAGTRDAKGRFVPRAAPEPESPEPEASADTAGEEQGAAPEADTEDAAPVAAKPEAAKPDAKVQALEQKHKAEVQRFAQGAQQAKAKIATLEDTVADRDAELKMYKRFVVEADEILRANKLPGFDPVVFEAARLHLDNERYKRQGKRRETQAQTEATERIYGQVQQRLGALQTKHPQLRSAEGAAWLKAYLTADPQTAPLAELEAQAAVWAGHIAAKQEAAQRQREAAAKPPVPVERQRPEGANVQGGGTTKGSAQPRSERAGRYGHLSNKSIDAHMNKFRVMKGGRR